MVHALRAERQQRVGQLPATVRESGRVPPGGTVAQRELHLVNGQAGLQRVDGHADLAAEAGGEREAAVAGALRQRALPGQRLPRPEAGARANECPRRPLGDPEATAARVRERGDRELGA